MLDRFLSATRIVRRFGLRLLPMMIAECVSHPFRLTDESAMRKLMATKHVAQIEQRDPSPIICFVESEEPGEIDLSLGEDHPDHTVRIGAYRVTSDGRVWMNSDPTLLEERWVQVE